MKNRIIYGTSRTRNTARCLKEINQFLKHGDGENLYIVVPEQFSSYYEKMLVDESEENGAFQAEVITFKRLAVRLFTKNLNIKTKYMDNAGKSMLLYTIINDLHDGFKAFSKASSFPAFSSEVLNMISEFKRYGAKENSIREAAAYADTKLLATKLNELAELYAAYKEKLENSGFWDSEDDLAELAEEISVSKEIERSIFWFDAFDGFTPAEMLVIRALMNKAIAVSTVLCTDSLSERDRSDVFYPVAATAAKIIDAAKSLGIGTEYINISTGDGYSNEQNDEMEHLACNYFKYPETQYDNIPGSIEITKADSIYEEVENCAREISRRVRNDGLRYGEICIVSGMYDEYSSYIDAVFSSYEIPVFLDEKRAIEKHPAARYILAVLDTYIEKYSYDSVFGLIKSPYSFMEIDSVSRLENYILEFNINGVEQWTAKPWEYRPYRCSDPAIIDDFNQWRLEITTMLGPIHDALRNGLTGLEFSKLIYGILEQQGVNRKIDDEAKRAADEGRLEYADELMQSWNILMDILDKITVVAGNRKMTAEKFRDMLSLAFSQKKIGLIPPRTDVVLAGHPAKAFGSNIKMLMILGTNDPGFPGSMIQEGLLSDRERTYLRECGFELAPDTTNQTLDRQLDIYNLINLPSERLYASYSAKGPDSSERRPAAFVERLMDIFPALEIKECSTEWEDTIYTPETGLFCAQNDTSTAKAIREWYRINGIEYVFSEKVEGITDNEFEYYISKLLGDALVTSATSLEDYSKCPFRYYARYILQAEDRREFSISAPDVGSIIHEILRDLVANHILDETRRDVLIEEAGMAFYKISEAGTFNRSNRLSYLGKRIIERSVDAFINIRRQIGDSDFTPVGLEVAFGKNKPIDSPVLEAGQGRVFLKGRIDRVDSALLDSGEYFRIIDYKSSAQNIKLCRIKEGLDMQLPLYLMAYMKHSGTRPAGMYYFNAAKNVVDADYNDNEISIEDKIQKAARLNGYTLSEKEIIKAMDKNFTGSSPNISVRVNKDGKYSGNLVSNEDIEGICRTITRHIVDKTEAIYDGNYEVNPVRYEKKWACEYCDYKGMCGFDKNNSSCRYRVVSETKDEDVEWDSE